MDIPKMIAELHEERAYLEEAIADLEQCAGHGETRLCVCPSPEHLAEPNLAASASAGGTAALQPGNGRTGPMPDSVQ